MFVNYSNSTIQYVQNFAARIYDLQRIEVWPYLSWIKKSTLAACITQLFCRDAIEMYDGSSAWVLSELYVNNKTHRIWTLSYNQELSTAKHSSSNCNRTENVLL